MPSEEDSKSETRVSIMINLNELQKGFKSSVLKELEAHDSQLDIRLMVRQYVGSIGTIHEKIREKIKDQVSEWESQIHSALNKFNLEHPEDVGIGIFAVKRNECGAYTDKIYLAKQGIEYRQKTETKNRSLRTLARRYVTSR